MATETLEDRLAVLESELAQLKHLLGSKKAQSAAARWEKIFGSFADSDGFDEAVRLGRQYRESLRPKQHRRAA